MATRQPAVAYPVPKGFLREEARVIAAVAKQCRGRVTPAALGTAIGAFAVNARNAVEVDILAGLRSRVRALSQQQLDWLLYASR